METTATTTQTDSTTQAERDLKQAQALVRASEEAEALIEDILFPRSRRRKPAARGESAELFCSLRLFLGEERTAEVWKLAMERVLNEAREIVGYYYANDYDPRPDQVAEGGAE